MTPQKQRQDAKEMISFDFAIQPEQCAENKVDIMIFFMLTHFA